MRLSKQKKRRVEYPEMKYRRWWFGKMCRVAGVPGPFRKVTGIKLIGPPSFVYGDVWLTFEDGVEVGVWHSDAFTPRKSDVEVQEEAPSVLGGNAVLPPTGVSTPNPSSPSVPVERDEKEQNL